MKTNYYKCDTCGRVVAELEGGAGILECCKTPMRKIEPKRDDSKDLKEKHLPTYVRKKDKIIVKVGNILHPSTKDHYIEWVSIVTNKGVYVKQLTSKDKPEVTFNVDEDEDIEEISSYCNLHALYTFSCFDEEEDEDCGCTLKL